MSALPLPAHEDQDQLVELLRGVGGQPHLAVMMVHLGNPLPQARARHGNGTVHTPKRTRQAQEALAQSMQPLAPPWVGNLALGCVFYRDSQRIVDGDNLLKLVQDAGTTARVWHDDSQITGAAFRVELDRENPRTVIALAPHVSTLRRDIVRVK